MPTGTAACSNMCCVVHADCIAISKAVKSLCTRCEHCVKYVSGSLHLMCLYKVAESSLTSGDYNAAASSFARAAALYAQGMSQTALTFTQSCLSSAESEVSDVSDASSLSEDTSAFSFFLPLREESDKMAGKAEKVPVADQSWWEEFGEWESACKVSQSTSSMAHATEHDHQDQAGIIQGYHTDQPDVAVHVSTHQHVTQANQPRLVICDQIVRLPTARTTLQLPYDSFPQLSKLTQQPVDAYEALIYRSRDLGPAPDWALDIQVICCSGTSYICFECNNGKVSLT